MQLAGNACSLLVRVGPAPERTENPEDEPDAEFTDSFLVPLTEETAAELLDQGPEPLYALAAELWRRVATDGFGHMLIGLSRGLEAVGGGGFPAAAAPPSLPRRRPRSGTGPGGTPPSLPSRARGARPPSPPTRPTPPNSSICPSTTGTVKAPATRRSGRSCSTWGPRAGPRSGTLA